MYEYPTTIEVPAASLDPMAHNLIQKFNECVVWQGTERIGGKTLKQVLYDCYNQVNGITAPEDIAAIEATGVKATVNLSALKCGTAQAFLNEAIVLSDIMPFRVEPTPIPDLSERGRMEALERFNSDWYGGAYLQPTDLLTVLREVKKAILDKEYEVAQEAARAMERLMRDQIVEGGWRNAMFSFITDFVTYPYAILYGPVPTVSTRLRWVNNRPVPRQETHYQFRSVSPWDFWYTPDSPDTQRGSGVFIRQRWTLSHLMQAKRLRSYMASEIDDILEDLQYGRKQFRWMSENPDQPDDYLKHWTNCTGTVDALIYYGWFSSDELNRYGITGLEEGTNYNAVVTMVAGKTIQVSLTPNPAVQSRPVFTASYYKTRDRIPNYSIPQKIRDVERCYHATLRYLMRNASNISGPIVEADYKRVIRHMTKEDMGAIVNDTIYFVDNDVATNTPAFRFYAQPNAVPTLSELLGKWEVLADKITDIPSILHGQSSGGGAQRTARGLYLLQGNATKSFQAATSNMDRDVFVPCGTLMYNNNMLFEKDESIKGDCLVYAQGVDGMLKKEEQSQTALEMLQLFASVGAQFANNPEGIRIVTYFMNQLMENRGVPDQYKLNPMSLMGGSVDPGGGMMSPGPDVLAQVGGM